MISTRTYTVALCLLGLLLLILSACEQLTTLRAQQYFNKAKQYYEEGNYSKAMEACDYALTFNPLLLDALTLKGMIYYKTGSYKSSLEFLTKAVMQKPDDKQLRIMLIDALLKAEKYGKALNEIRFLLSTSPHDPELKFLYYFAHIKSRNDSSIGKIRDELQGIVNQGCDDPRMHCLAAELEILKGNLQQAKALLLEHYTLHPVWQTAMQLLADAFRANGDYENVIAIYNAIAEKVEDKKIIYEELAEVLFNNKQFVAAENILKELYKQYPDDTSLRQKLIDCLMATKKFDEAICIIDAAAKNQPDDVALTRTKVDILIRKNDLDTALTLAQSIATKFDVRSPLSLEFKNKIAEILFLQGKYNDAKAQANEVLLHYPNDAQARFILCKIELQTSSSITLIGELRQLINENPSNADYYYYLGLVHQKRNEEVMADKAFREALGKDPGHKGALLALAEKNFKLGSYNIVDKDIQNYFKIHPDDNETKQLLNNMKMNRHAPP